MLVRGALRPYQYNEGASSCHLPLAPFSHEREKGNERKDRLRQSLED